MSENWDVLRGLRRCQLSSRKYTHIDEESLAFIFGTARFAILDLMIVCGEGGE